MEKLVLTKDLTLEDIERLIVRMGFQWASQQPVPYDNSDVRIS